MSSIIEQRIATLLGNLGLLPFVALAIAVWMPWESWQLAKLQAALVAYAAVILSFLGAVHWGLVMATPNLERTQAWNALLWGVMPALLGWLALLMLMLGVPAWVVLGFLVGDLWLARLVDGSLMPMYAAPAHWYLGLRTRLTVIATLALGAAAVAAAR
jgi:hypothetical protein